MLVLVLILVDFVTEIWGLFVRCYFKYSFLWYVEKYNMRTKLLKDLIMPFLLWSVFYIQLFNDLAVSR